MPDVREVYEMVTKQKPPDPGALERQRTRQVRTMRNRKVGAFAVVAALLGVAAIVAVNSLPDRGRTDPVGDDPTVPVSIRSGRFLLDLGTGATRPLPDGVPYGAFYAVSPDGTMVATNPCCDASDPLFVANVDGTGVRELTGNVMDGYGPSWSPDGTMLVFQGRDGSTLAFGDLFVVDVASGKRTRITNLDQEKRYGWWFLSPSFSPDGRSVLFHLPAGSGISPRDPARWDLWSVPISGGEPTLVRRDASMGAYAPDGTLAYGDPTPDPADWTSPTLLISDAGDASPRAVAEGDAIEFPRWSPDGTRIAYVDSGAVYVLDVATGETSHVADGDWVHWFDDDTLVISSSPG
jgi:Tol biopolymer transport system component